jgi:hypothetical protein
VPDRGPAQPVDGPTEKPVLDKPKRNDSDLIFVRRDTRESLARIGELEPYIRRSSGIWVLTRKGSKEANQNDAIRAGLAAGLVDNKNAAFSEERSALRLVIPLARR